MMPTLNMCAARVRSTAADPPLGRGAGGHRPRRHGAALSLGAALLAACTPMTAVRNVASNWGEIDANLRQPAAVAAARNTVLLRSGRLFFPDDQPIRRDVLPVLSDPQIELIGQILDAELQQVRAAQLAHVAMLAREFPGHDAARVRMTVEPKRTGAAWADSLPESGRIRIDARVVQAIYRAALIAVFAPRDDQAGAAVETAAALERREDRAFAAFGEYRRRLNELAPVRALGDLRALQASNPERERALGRTMSGALAMMEGRLVQAETVAQSKLLERAFLGAIRFMLAHEAGHVALAHPVSPADCGQAIANELTADRYAVLVSDLAAYPRIPGIVLQRGATASSTTALMPFEDWVMAPSDGAAQFFDFAYGLAGFDLRFNTVPDCLYPTPAVRIGAIAPLAAVIDEVHRLARDQQALRRFGTARTRQGLRSFEGIFPRLRGWEQPGRPFPADLAALQPLLTEIFYETYNRPD